MVERTRDGGVRPGSAISTLQPTMSLTARIEDQLRPLLAELVANFDENAALSIDDGDRLLYLADAKAEHAVSVPDVADHHHDFHVVAPGLVTMASWPTERVNSYLKAELSAPSPFAMIDPAALRNRLKHIRSEGHAWTNQELDVGVNGLAVGIFDDGQLVATVSLFGPDYRFSETRKPDLAAAVKTVVSRAGETLLHAPRIR